ncbi:hypothetical protein [Kutzneria sp. NPDC051319]
MPIIEGLDLAAAEPGPYELTCLPIRLTAAEAAPARPGPGDPAPLTNA